MKLLAENGDYKLYYVSGQASYNFIVMKKVTDYFSQEMARAYKICKKLTKFFTPIQVMQARAKVHAIDYVAKKFRY